MIGPFLGNDGWSWDQLLPYYLKTENFTDPTRQQAQDLDIQYIDSNVHGEQGPLHAAYCPTYDVFHEAWGPTFENLGLNYTGDPFDGVALGGFTMPFSLNPDTVTRSYAANAYYTPNANRTNLHLSLHSLVTKVLFEDGTGSPRLSTNGRGPLQPPHLTASGFTVHGQRHHMRCQGK